MAVASDPSNQTTSPEAAEGTENLKEDESHTGQEDNRPETAKTLVNEEKKATKAQIQMIQKVAGDLGMTEAMVCKEAKASLYTELSQEAAGEILTWLKNLK
jgi:hypothetical protein